jgi:hypothetical protein
VSRGIDFEDCDVEKSLSCEQKPEATGGQGVPLVTVGDETMEGWNRYQFEQLYRRQQADSG